MRWYNQMDFPVKGEPIVVKTLNNRVFVGMHQTVHKSSMNPQYTNSERWVKTINQQTIKWDEIKEWHYVDKFVEVIEKKF